MVDEEFEDRILLAEANQWPEDVVHYYGTDDAPECHMAFHFPVMPRLFMSVRREESRPIVDILQNTPAIPANAQWGIFLRNHDELTLEMVTDEERDYMYAEYARDARMRANVGIRRRLAPLLENSRNQIQLFHSLLLSLPGSPVMYYGDEIGMGDNIYLGDRDGVRTPMQWNPDRNAGFSRADFAQLYLPPIMDPVYGYEALNVEAQQRQGSSLLHWVRNLVHIRKEHPVFGMGDFEALESSNPRVLSFLRRDELDTILVVANLGSSAQPVELDLSRFSGATPVEMLGGARFPQLGELPYLLTLWPHGFFWFRLEPGQVEAE
jgi:maltose alpha-D-glucosyltransferase/alpha-amylase